MRAWVAAAVALFPSAALAQDLDTGWRSYVNARFGVSVDYPDIFAVRGREPDNGDGQSFTTADGHAKLTVYGSYNIDRRSPAQLLQAYKAEGVNYAYAQTGRGWFVLSGTKGDTIGYMRCNLGAGDVVGCFDLEYPAAQAASWAPVVERLGRSLRVGRR